MRRRHLALPSRLAAGPDYPVNPLAAEAFSPIADAGAAAPMTGAELRSSIPSSQGLFRFRRRG